MPWGGGRCWDPAEGALYWADIPTHQVHRLAADGTHTAWDHRPAGRCHRPRACGGKAAKDGFWAMDPGSGQLALLAHVEPDISGNRMNGGASRSVTARPPVLHPG
ncbi:MAG: SMP-30/gluconolactonase/LRE family protein [Micromonosporaceae bacterium]